MERIEVLLHATRPIPSYGPRASPTRQLIARSADAATNRRASAVGVDAAEIGGDAIEHAIYERPALLAAEALRELDGLVEDDGARNVRALHELPRAEPEHVA